jgi:hypothetical protein
MRTLVAFALSLLSLCAMTARAEDVVKTFDAATIKKLTLENALGNVTVKGKDDKAATVTARKKKFEDGCKLDLDLAGSELRVVNKEPEAFLNRKCEVDFDVVVPHQIALDLKLGAGNVEIGERRPPGKGCRAGGGRRQIREW